MKRLLSVLVMIASSWALSAQSAQIMDGIVGSQALSGAQASYLVLVGSGQLAESATPEQAFRLLDQLGWTPWLRSPEDKPSEADFAWMLAKAFRVPAGVLASLLPGPRYTYRDFVFRGWASASHDPGSWLSGDAAIRMLGKVMDANTRTSGAPS